MKRLITLTLLGMCGWAISGCGDKPRPATRLADPATTPQARGAESRNTKSSLEAMQVACVQLDNTPDVMENARRIVAALEAEARLGTRLVVFPECALTTYNTDIIGRLTQSEIDEATRAIQEACRRYDVYAVIGSACRKNEKWYNTADVIDPAGKIIKRYAKLHVVRPRFFTDGNELAIFRVDDVPFTIMICHDERYPEIFRIPVLAGAKVGIYISCESKRQSKWDNYRSQIIARAVENEISVIHCNSGDGGADGGSHGHSRIIDPRGNVLAEAGMEIGASIRAVIHPRDSGNTHATRGANTPSLKPFWAEGLRVLTEQNPEYLADQP